MNPAPISCYALLREVWAALRDADNRLMPAHGGNVARCDQRIREAREAIADALRLIEGYVARDISPEAPVSPAAESPPPAPPSASGAGMREPLPFWPVGTPVVLTDDLGDRWNTETRTRPYVLGYSNVVCVNGIAGGYLCDRMVPGHDPSLYHLDDRTRVTVPTKEST